MQTMPDFITKERERLHAEREAIFTKQQELETKLAEINREFAAIEAYEAAKSGKAAAASRPRQPRQSGSRRSSKRDGILEVINANPGGLTRGELLEKLGVKGDKSGEMSVSNALTGLTKGNQIRREDGKYLAG